MADRALRNLDAVPAGDVGRAEVPALYDGEPRRVQLSDVLASASSADSLDLSRLSAAIRDNIPDGAFLLELGGVRLRLPGAALADFIDNAIREDTRQGEDGRSAWNPLFRGVVDGERRGLEIYDWEGGTGDKPGVGFISEAGLVATKAEMENIRGEPGRDGGGGGAGAPVNRLGRTAANKLLLASSNAGSEDVSSAVLALGGAGRSATRRRSALAADATVQLPTSDSYSGWEDLAEITVGAAEAGVILLEGEVQGVAQNTTPPGGGNRIYVDVRIQRTRGAATTTRTQIESIYLRNNTQGNANFNAASTQFDFPIAYDDDALEGDVYKVQVRYIQQAGTAGVSVVHAVANNWLDLLALGQAGEAASLTAGLVQAATVFPAGASTGQFVEVAADVPAAGVMVVRIGDRTAFVPATFLRGLNAASAGDVPAADTSISWGGSSSGGGGGGVAISFASEAETTAGVVGNKAVSPLTLKDELVRRTGDADGFSDADSDKLLPEGVFAALTVSQREVLLKLLGVLTLDGHWSRVGGERTWANVPVGLPFDTTLDVPADADDVRVSFETGPTPGGGVFVVSVATLRGLPALAANPPSFTVSQAGWHVVQDSRGNDWGVALRGSRLWVASDLDPAPRNLPYSAYLDVRTGQLEDFCAADRSDRVPPAKMAAGWLPFTAALKSKLDRIEAEAQVNVQSDLSVTDTESKSYVRGQRAFKASLPRGVDVSALPTALAGATTEVVVKEADDRRDAVVSFQMVAGQEYYGHGRGAVVAPTDASGDVETDTWNAEVFGLLWDSGDRNLDGWLKVGSVWDKVVVNGVEHAMTELGQGQLPWDTSAPAPVYRRVQVALSAAEATAIDDGLNAVRLNLRDTDEADLGRAYVVGNPYIRESVRADDRLNAAGVQGVLAQEFQYVDALPDGHEADNVTYLFPPPAG